MTRNKILMNGSPHWITLPVYKGKQIRIKDLKIASDTQFKRIFGSLESAMGNNFFPQIFQYIQNIYNKQISLRQSLIWSLFLFCKNYEN